MAKRKRNTPTKVIRLTQLDTAHAITSLVKHISRVADKGTAGKDVITLKFPDEYLYFPPFSMVYLGIAVRQIRKKTGIYIVYDNTDADWLGYAKKFGFFDYKVKFLLTC